MRVWRILQYAIGLTWILLVLAGCGAPGAAPGAVAASSEKRIKSPDVPRADRPFIVFIRDIKTDTILFVGWGMNPASE